MFIPILPSALLEFLSAPTPYIMGVHESYKDTLAPDLVSATRFNLCLARHKEIFAQISIIIIKVGNESLTYKYKLDEL